MSALDRPIGTLRARARPGPGVPLVWRIFLANAAILVLASVALLLTPVTVSDPVAPQEAAAIVGGIALMLVVTLAALRRAFAPLERLAAHMSDIDLLDPGRRVDDHSPDAEVNQLAAAFNDMLERLEAERRTSSARAAEAQEDERRRVARELHDHVGQILTGVLLQSDRAVRDAPADLRPQLEELRDATRAALDDVRRIARTLRPEALDDLGLASALTALAAGFARQSGLHVVRDLDSAAAAVLDRERELVVYRVAQESLTNVARHAGATEVELRLVRENGSIVLTVADDGRGLPDRLPSFAGGVRGMRERALAHASSLTVTDRRGGGTVVRLEVPPAP